MGCLACLWRLARLPRGLPRLPLATGSVASCTRFLPFWSFCDSFIHSFFPISGFAVAFAQRAEGFTGNTSRPQLELLTTSTNYIYTASNTSSDLKDSTPTTTKTKWQVLLHYSKTNSENPTLTLFLFFLFFLFFFFLNTEKWRSEECANGKIWRMAN